MIARGVEPLAGLAVAAGLLVLGRSRPRWLAVLAAVAGVHVPSGTQTKNSCLVAADSGLAIVPFP